MARGLDPAPAPVRPVLSQPVIPCDEADTFRAAMDLLAANHIRRMPVRNAALQAALLDTTKGGAQAG